MLTYNLHITVQKLEKILLLLLLLLTII